MEKFKDIIEKIEKLSVLELSELVKMLEEKFGVSASQMAVSAPGAGGGTGEAEAKDSFTVVLKSAGDQKINVIKVVREVTSLGLKEAKELVESAPKPVKTDLKKADADEIRKKFESIGAIAELQ